MTIRVIPCQPDRYAATVNRSWTGNPFELLGVTGEGIETYGIVALDVPAQRQPARHQGTAASRSCGRKIGYEEGRVNDDWIEL